MFSMLGACTVLLLCTSWVSGQVLDRNCFGSENSTLSDTFLASPVNEDVQAAVYAGERAFAVNLIKALFKKFETEKIEENIFISPSSIFHTLLLTYFGARGETEKELEQGLGKQRKTTNELSLCHKR